MKLSTGITRLLLLLLPVTRGYGQTQHLPAVMATIQAQLKNIPEMGYNYTVVQKLPGGGQNTLKGKVVKTRDFYLESNPQQLVIENKSWYYKLDHTNKTVTILNLERIRNAAKKKALHQSDNISLIPDSIIERYGKINVTNSGTIVTVAISFSDLLIKELDLQYDNQKKLPVLYKIDMDRLYSITEGNYEETYLHQTFVAKDFTARPDVAAGNLSSYFTNEGGTIKLKKYTNYQLIQQSL